MEDDNKSMQPGEQQIGSIPVGIDVLVKKASVDSEFRQMLLEKRGEAAREIGLELTEAEQKMLSSISLEQLEKIIDNTKVKPDQRSIFRGKAVKLMLAAAAGLAVVSMFGVTTSTAGISPDRVRKMKMDNLNDSNDVNDPNKADFDGLKRDDLKE
ncbi:MAG: hypothetical protein H8D56_20575 [Planctomycetes bacterium]|nr:hypothetical protein [Planctomycetota bacterium]MBL7146192.1 hypothetical protein [Phycisphaerae bacterium]